MRVVKYSLQTLLHFLIVFGTIAVLVMIFLYFKPMEPWEWKIRVETTTPITLEEYQTIFDPSKPDPRQKEYRNARFHKQAARN